MTGKVGSHRQADRAGGPTDLSRDASQPEALIPCAVCRTALANPYGSQNQPSGAVEFITPGHYGTAVFDPMDGSALAINVCDDCLRTLRKDRAIAIYRGGKLKKWSRS